MARSDLIVDLGAIRRNARTLLTALAGAELWAVVKADGYGHGALDVGGVALRAGASALCVATVPEGLALRRELGPVRILVMGPATSREIADARDAGLELVIADGEVPEGVRPPQAGHGMGRWGLAELPAPGREVVGLMSHFASADCDAAFTELQMERFGAATAEHSSLTRHIANSAGALRYPSARFDAARCGIALYGISPFGTDPAEDGLEPALRWESQLAQVRQAPAGRLDRLWPPVGRGAADVDRDRPRRLRRRLPARPDRDGGPRRRRAAPRRRDRLDGRVRGRARPRAAIGTPVTLLGHGVQAEAHARAAGTIGYEIVTGISRSPEPDRRSIVDS